MVLWTTLTLLWASTCLVLVVTQRDELTKIIQLKQGQVQGRIAAFRNIEQKVQVFKGIPFAAPPVGSLRFLPPVQAPTWKGVKVADTFAPVCPQRFPNTTDRQASLNLMSAARYRDILKQIDDLQNQNEDCLYLNVYSPLLEGKHVVYIYE